ncbi:hypothetical protein EE612_041232, partial [Oryza sativa]
TMVKAVAVLASSEGCQGHHLFLPRGRWSDLCDGKCLWAQARAPWIPCARSVTPLMAACQLDHTSILLGRNMGHH